MDFREHSMVTLMVIGASLSTIRAHTRQRLDVHDKGTNFFSLTRCINTEI